MGVGTFIALPLGILAVVFVDDLGITRAQLGLVFAVNTVGAAVLSPFVGRITDRIGGRSALVVVAIAAAVAFLVLGAASSLGMLVAGSMIGAIAQAGSNPATNKLIAEDLPSGSQGIVTGIKQSGVQAFVFIGGLMLPAMALAGSAPRSGFTRTMDASPGLRVLAHRRTRIGHDLLPHMRGGFIVM